jgi:polyvinyl alcohol dehydrogenase (cytochrome)
LNSNKSSVLVIFVIVVLVFGSVLAALFIVGQHPNSSKTSDASIVNSTSTMRTRSFTSQSKTITTSSLATSTSTAGYNAYTNNWLTYHGNYSRVGLEQNGVQNFGSAKEAWESSTLDGTIYAEPLIFNGTIFAATEGDSIYALSEVTGSVLWQTHLGDAVSTSNLGVPSSCWTIDPIGITSTPTIDPLTGTLYAVG